MIKKAGLLALCLISLYLRGHAQRMNLTEWSDTKSSFAISDIRKIEFSEGNMIISLHDANPAAIAITDICHVNFTDLSTGDDPLEELNIEIPILFPNPVQDNLSLNYNSSEKIIQFEIWTMDGKIVYRNIHNVQPGTNHTDINVTSLSKGIYLLRLVENQAIRTLKFMKY